MKNKINWGLGLKVMVKNLRNLKVAATVEAILTAVLTATAQPYYVDLTTPQAATNTVSGNITIPGVTNNAPYTATNPVTNIGDPLGTAFNKLNLDIYFIWNWLATNTDLGGGGSLTNGAYVPIFNGGATNLTVTNSLTLISTTPYYTIGASRQRASAAAVDRPARTQRGRIIPIHHWVPAWQRTPAGSPIFLHCPAPTPPGLTCWTAR